VVDPDSFEVSIFIDFFKSLGILLNRRFPLR